MSASSFFGELKRRQIYRGGVMYVVAGWVIVQVSTTLFPIFNIPGWAIRLVVVALMLGFPLALVALWMGIYPKPFLEPLKAPVGSLMARLERAAPPQTPHTPIVATAPVQMASATVGDAK